MELYNVYSSVSDFFCPHILRFIHVVVGVNSLWLSIAKQYCIVWVYHSLLFHPPMDGHLDYFQFLAILNQASMNIHVQVFVWTSVLFFFGNYPGVE